MKDFSLYKLTNDNFFPSYVFNSSLMVEIALIKLINNEKPWAIVISGADDYSLVSYFYSYYEALRFLSTKILPMEFISKDKLKSLGFV